MPVLVGPQAPPWATEAVERGGGRVVGPGQGAEGIVWASWSPAGLLDLVAESPEVRWVQLPMAGVERWVEAGVFADPRARAVSWTCAKGTFAEPVAEHALALALAGLRQIPVRARATSWGKHLGTSLYDASVTILGAGGIAQELVKLLGPFRVEVTVVRRGEGPMEGAHRTLPSAELHSALPSALVVFIALALLPETVHVISGPELSLMRRDAWLVNVGRGRHVDTGALVRALSVGEVGGAALDVTEPEPLPDGHPLWTLPNCLITPHTANTDAMAQPLLARRIADNVSRLASGRPLVGTVDVVAGY